MATLAFNFVNTLANRIANINTHDIARLEQAAFGTVTNFQTKYKRPFKAYYANDLAKRAAQNTRAAAIIERDLPEYERKAQEYMSDPNRKGRPLTTFINVSEPENIPTPNESDEEPQDDAVAQIVQDNIPMPQKPGPRKPATPKPADSAGVDLSEDAAAALKALLDTLTPKPQAVGVDEEAVRAIAREEAAKFNAPKPTLIQIKPADDAQPVMDMGVQHAQFPLLLQVMQTKMPIWLPGPAGSGKTTAAANVAKALSIAFHHTGAVDNVYQLLGFIDAGGTYHRTEFREAYENGGVFLWDEVDGSNPAALVAFNAAIENGHCAFPDKVVAKHADCYFIAAANTYGQGATHEYVGRNKMDAATLDRFVMLDWQYDETLERAIAGDNEWTSYVQKMRRAAKSAGVKHLITPRASIRGNMLLAAGVPKSAVVNMTVRKGLSDDQWSMIEARAR